MPARSRRDLPAADRPANEPPRAGCRIEGQIGGGVGDRPRDVHRPTGAVVDRAQAAHRRGAAEIERRSGTHRRRAARIAPRAVEVHRRAARRVDLPGVAPVRRADGQRAPVDRLGHACGLIAKAGAADGERLPGEVRADRARLVDQRVGPADKDLAAGGAPAAHQRPGTQGQRGHSLDVQSRPAPIEIDRLARQGPRVLDGQGRARSAQVGHPGKARPALQPHLGAAHRKVQVAIEDRPIAQYASAAGEGEAPTSNIDDGVANCAATKLISPRGERDRSGCLECSGRVIQRGIGRVQQQVFDGDAGIQRDRISRAERINHRIVSRDTTIAVVGEAARDRRIGPIRIDVPVAAGRAVPCGGDDGGGDGAAEQADETGQDRR